MLFLGRYNPIIKKRQNHPLIWGLLTAIVMAASGCTGMENTLDSDTSQRTPIPASNSPSVQASYGAERTVRFGVLSIDSAVSVNRRYRPLLDYLQEKTGYLFELVPLSQDSQFSEVQAKKLDFITNNPLAAVQVQRLHQTDFIATTNRPKTGTQFSAIIIVRDGSDIQTVDDLKGKRAACVNFATAAAGCTFQIRHLKQQGFDPFEDFESFIENPSQDNIVLAVLNNTIDVGFIRTGQLEKMTANGLIRDTKELRIIDPQDSDFFYTHTTTLYPEWPIASLKSTNPDLIQAVQQALLEIPEDHPALEAAKFKGFVEPVDYDPIRQLIEELKLKSWDVD